MPSEWILQQTVAPTVEPVSVDELKVHARIANADTGQDGVLTRCIALARDQFEIDTGWAIMAQTFLLRLKAMPHELLLMKTPVRSVDSVIYVDPDGADQTVDPLDYRFYPGGYSSGRIALLADSWGTPSSTEAYPWSITYQCGATNKADVPLGVKGALLWLATYLYDNREAVTAGTMNNLPHTYQSCVNRYRTYHP